MTLNIAVCIKPVPDSEHYNKITIDPKTKRVNREGIDTVINTMDKNAIELALQLKEKHGGKVTGFSMAPDSAVEDLRKALAMGVDEAYLLSDKKLAGSDTLATSYALSKVIEKTGKYDLIILGNETEDGGTAQVPSQLGEWINIPHLTNVKDVRYIDGSIIVETKTEIGEMKYRVKLPALIGVLREINTPRIPNLMGIIKAKNKPITTLRVSDLCIDEGRIGLIGSPTQAGEIFTIDMKRKSQEIKGSYDEIAEKILDLIKKIGI